MYPLVKTSSLRSVSRVVQDYQIKLRCFFPTSDNGLPILDAINDISVSPVQMQLLIRKKCIYSHGQLYIRVQWAMPEWILRVIIPCSSVLLSQNYLMHICYAVEEKIPWRHFLPLYHSFSSCSIVFLGMPLWEISLCSWVGRDVQKKNARVNKKDLSIPKHKVRKRKRKLECHLNTSAHITDDDLSIIE